MNLLFLDAQTNDKSERITAFGDGLEGLAREFQDWIKEKNIKPEDIWYADIFEHIAKNMNRHAYSLNLLQCGDIEVMTPLNPVKNPYKRKRGLFR